MSKLKIFLGYADDASSQIQILKKGLKEKVNKYLQEDLPESSNNFSHCEFFEWKKNASSCVGGQKDKINPHIKNADICIFTFFQRIGETTKEEVLESKKSSKYIICLFPDKKTLNDSLFDLSEDEEFKIRTNITNYKKSLTENWNEKNSQSITPSSEYNDKTLVDIAFEKVKKIIQELLDKDKKNEELSQSSNTKNIIEEIKIPSICVFVPFPLNYNIDYELRHIRDSFKKYKVNLSIKTLNEDNLIYAEDYDYNFIFSKTNEKKIIIEDEYFIKKSIDLEELEEFINTNNTLLFLDKEIENSNFNIKIIPNSSKIKQILPHTLKKDYNFQKGNYNLEGYLSPLADEIDERNLKNFVGRNTDIEIIIKKILDIKNEKNILTIKGSGGIGKTTLISKIAVEFSKRNIFKDGIKFLQCEFIKNYEEFENKISFAFDMNNAINLKEQIKEQIEEDEERLIILDNIETILHIEDTEKIKKFINFISKYAIIVITSREKLNEEIEEVYDLRDFTTDEAEELFLKEYPIKNYDRKFLRVSILEEMLDNNPLAIKIVSNNIPKGKNLKNLKEDLNKSFFSVTNTEMENIFDKESDLNIKRTKSLFHSINYSYLKLSAKEKLAIELLSLFPDGINLENFKGFYNQKIDSNLKNKEKTKKLKEISDIKKNSFSDKDLKCLEDKSLIIVNNQNINLQSIIGRFASFKLRKRDNTELIEYYKKAFMYNDFIVFLLEKKSLKENIRISLFERNKNNLLKSLDYIRFLDVDNDLIEYIDDLCDFFADTSPNKEIFQRLEILKNHFKENIKFKELINSIILILNYYYYDFEEVFNTICKDYPFEEIKNKWNSYSKIELLTNSNILSIYQLEGLQYDSLKLLLSRKSGNSFSSFQIGNYKFYKSFFNTYYSDKFTDLEFQLNIEEINIREIKDYIESINKNQIIEKVQVSYLLIKASPSELKLKDIKKLTVSNPYTEGLKLLMLAIKSESLDKKEAYEKALEKLFHIKYYYVEGILLYCKYLKNKDKDYVIWFKKGKELAKKYYYRYLLHCFICLDSNEEKQYNEDDYPLPEKLDYSKVYPELKFKG